jgi:exocyst complex component 2
MRLLLTLCKFHQLKEITLPTILSSTSKSLDTDLSHDRDTLVEVVDNMDQLVFEDYIKRRSRVLVETMEGGILRGGVDWAGSGKPTGEFFPSSGKDHCFHLTSQCVQLYPLCLRR